jgi:hypothetical protein
MIERITIRKVKIENIRQYWYKAGGNSKRFN